MGTPACIVLTFLTKSQMPCLWSFTPSKVLSIGTFTFGEICGTVDAEHACRMSTFFKLSMAKSILLYYKEFIHVPQRLFLPTSLPSSNVA